MKIDGFDWDEFNIAKVKDHDLDVDEIEELFESGDPVFMRNEEHPGRQIALGFVPDGRFVLVSYERDDETRWIRVVTAYEPTHEKWHLIYSKAKGTPRR